LPGDFFIARGFVPQEHYGTTLGGGEILRVHAPKVRRTGNAKEVLDLIAKADLRDRVAIEVRGADSAGMTADAVCSRLGLAPGTGSDLLEELVARGDIVAAGGGARDRHFCHAQVFARLEKRAADLIGADDGGLPKAELREKLTAALPPVLFEELVQTLVRRRAAVEDGVLLRRAAIDVTKVALSPLATTLLEHYADWGCTPKRPKEIPGNIGEPEAAVKSELATLLAKGELVKVKADLLFHKDCVNRLRRDLEAHLDEHGQITPAQWKDITGTSRKYSIPLAEYFDQERLTLRVGDIRKRRG
jgi:selenocysteine-specific elongation factor